MRSLNRATILGNVTRDPDLKTTQGGQPVCTLSVATNRVWKDAQGEPQSLAEFHNLVVFGGQATFVGQNVKKGKLVYAEGYLKTRSYPHSQHPDVMLYRTEIVVETLILLSPREAQPQDDDPAEPTPF